MSGKRGQKKKKDKERWEPTLRFHRHTGTPGLTVSEQLIRKFHGIPEVIILKLSGAVCQKKKKTPQEAVAIKTEHVLVRLTADREAGPFTGAPERE